VTRRAARFGACLALAGLAAFAGLAAAGPAAVGWERSGRDAVLLVTAGAAADSLSFTVALPPAGGWRLAGLSLDGREADPAGLVRLAEPAVFRRVRVGRLAFTPGGRPWREAAIRLAFDAAPAAGEAAAGDALLTAALVNPGEARRIATAPARRVRGSRADELFDGSGRWLRVDVEESGLYALDYETLAAWGVPAGADAATFRVLGTLGREQPFPVGGGGSWERGWTLTEIPLQVVGGDSFGPDSELRCYLPGAVGFATERDPAAAWEDHFRHPYSPWASYWLTWGGAPGARVDSLDAAPTGLDPVAASLPVRLRREQNQIYSARYLHEDGWGWYYFTHNDVPVLFQDTCALLWPAADRPFRLRVGFDMDTSNQHHVLGYLDAADADHLFFDEIFGYSSQAILDGTRDLPADIEGRELCTFLLSLPKDLGDDSGYLLWYEVHYETRPRTRFSRALDLYVPDAAASAELRASGFTHRPEVWDVTDPTAPLRLTGGAWEGDSLAFRLDTHSRRHLIVVDPLANPGLGFKAPLAVRQFQPALLRNDAAAPHLVVVAFDDFLADARRYAAWREDRYPGQPAGEVEVVATSDIWANFGGGMQDVAALRNFVKYRYDADGSRLEAVLLLGDADSDYRNHLNRETLGDGTNSLVPALSDRFRSESLYYNEYYTTDDYICSLDAADDETDHAVPDVAVGRLPAASRESAARMVDAVIGYEGAHPADPWQDRVVLAADDYFYHCQADSPDGINHTGQAERVAAEFPPALDIEKIYLCEYDCDYAGFKTRAQQRLFAALDEGVLLFNYVGHGGNDTLADEQLLLTASLYSLANGLRRFVFVSASCNVGEYDDPDNVSMTETMLDLDDGGAIGTVASTAVSGAGFNNLLNRFFLQHLFPGRQMAPRTPLGASLLLAKVDTQAYYGGSQGHQNERYALLGDPALDPVAADLTIAFDTVPDTLRVGGTVLVAGRVLRDGETATDFAGDLWLSVRASADTSGHDWFTGYTWNHQDYHLPGPEIFRGRLQVSAGAFASPSLFVPGLPDSALGPYGRIRAFAVGDGEEAAGRCDSLPVVTGTLPGDETPPVVRLRLAGGATHATPGMELVLHVESETGVNLVGHNAHNAIFLEYAEAGEVENLTDQFEYDWGSATSGEVRTTLPAGLPEGDNTLVASVADNLGNVGRDTLRVAIYEEGRADLMAVQPFPNPFAGRCLITFDVTAPASVECTLFTLSGRRLRRLALDCPAAGRFALEWDGRDEAGDQVANGTYLYRVTASLGDDGARKREETGAVVRMRE